MGFYSAADQVLGWCAVFVVSIVVASALAVAVIPACLPGFRRAHRRAVGMGLALAVLLAAVLVGWYGRSGSTPVAGPGSARVQLSAQHLAAPAPTIPRASTVGSFAARGPRAGAGIGRPAAAAIPVPGPKLAVAGPRVPQVAKAPHGWVGPQPRPDYLLPTAAEPSPDGSSWQTPTTWAEPGDWAQRGTIVSTTLYGRVSGFSERAYVYLPPVYFGAAPARNLPIAVVFSGYPGTADELITRGHYPDAVLTGLTAGQVVPMVLVMLPPTVNFPWDTECTDIPDGPQAFTFYSRDVPDAVADQFHLHPTGYASIGDSTGGYCAAKLEALDPSRFTVAVSLSGYFHPAVDPSTRGEFDDASLRDRNDLGWRLKHLPAPPVSLLLATAYDERGLDGYDTSAEWIRLVKAPMTARELILEHGSHNFTSWGEEIPYGLSWISAKLPGSHVAQAPAPTDSVLTDGTEPGDTASTGFASAGTGPAVEATHRQPRA
jgi:Putative esterase